jgi:MYXO-CTERM domain-containing protein
MIACHYPGGAKSCGANSCTSSGGTYIEKHTSICNGSGACSDDPKTCVGYTCSTTSCKTSCTANTDCATGFYCKTGACVPIEGLGTACTTATTCTSGFCTDGVCCAVGSCGSGRSCSAGTGTLKGVCVSLNGTACSADAECASGVCADGVCCDSACGGSCEACNKAGSVGKCVPVVGDPLTGHPACTGTSTDSDCAARCDGTDGKNCKYPGTTSVCGKPSCGGGVEVQVSTCDGAGTCKPSSKTCSPYVCGPTACLASCTKNDDCGSGNYCKTGSCVKNEALGKACGSTAECESGFCADGVCCSVATCGEGSSCAGADSTTPGTCLKKKGVACTKADECATGRCVDGFCCDLACNGQCEACDIGGSEGTCTPVVGPPHGTDRIVCDTLDAKDCAKAQCDGKARDKCNGFANGGTTACGMASCTTDKRYQAIGACDGAGKCAMPEPTSCVPWACDATASSGCKSSCATDDDCAADFKCEGGACIQGAKCSEDRSQSIAKTGEAKDCKPYRCGSDGKCATSCATSDDCAPGTACDPNAKACVIYSVDDSGGDGGCGCATPGSQSSPRAYVLGALVALAALRRRRSGASSNRS